MKWFKEQAWEVHVAANGNMELPYVDKKYDIPIQRSPLKLQNFYAYKELASIIKHNKYNIIHCHTPMGGVLARLAARKARKQGTRVIYTAHGFHFCKGAPLINWLIYYPIEKGLASYTDCLITINQEDYTLAMRHRFKAERIERVHGIGVDTERFKPVKEFHKQNVKMQFGYKPSDFLMFYAAEFNKNKNQQLLLHSLSLLKNKVPHAKLLLAGNGPLMEDCKKLAVQLGIAEMVHFLGYRTDIVALLPMCDIAVASSLREGLPVNIMEAMACGLPVVATDNRGHRELVLNNENGWIVDRDDIEEMSNKMKLLAQNPKLNVQFGSAGRMMVENTYAINEILEEKEGIYAMLMDETEELKWAIH